MAFAPLHIKTATFYNCHFCYSSSQSPPVLSRSEWKMPTVSLPYLLLFLSCLTASSTLSFCRDPLAWFIFMLDFVCLYCSYQIHTNLSLTSSIDSGDTTLTIFLSLNFAFLLCIYYHLIYYIIYFFTLLVIFSFARIWILESRVCLFGSYLSSLHRKVPGT